jgi:hypothetical protein
MQRMFFKVIALSLGIALSVLAYQKAPAKPKAPKNGNIQGTVRVIAKDKSEITVHTSQTAGATDRIVIYSAATTWGLGSSKKQAPSSLDKLKEGYFLNCVGPFEGVKLAATSCYFRETK